MKTIYYILPLCILVLSACTEDVAERAESLQNNVVAIRVAGQEGSSRGFGFISGQQGEKLYVVTAEHVVAGANQIAVELMGITQRQEARLVYANPDYEVAVLEITSPPPHTWYQNCLGSGSIGDDVGFIGRVGEWEITRGNEIGSIKSFGLNKIRCYLPTVEVGTSGAPLIHHSGIIGMIINDQNTSAEAVDITTIRQLLQEEQPGYFTLAASGFAAGAVETVQGPTVIERELAIFTQAQEADAIDAYQRFIRSYPDSKFRPQAEKRIEELQALAAIEAEDQAWDAAKADHTIEAYQAYLQQFPSGRYRDEAQEKMAALEKESTAGSTPDNPETKIADNEVSNRPQPPPIKLSNGMITDDQGNTYTTKVLKDGKRWMTQNLNLRVDDSWCYENDADNCDNYGRLYTWEAAKEACAELGDGWRLPTDDEWQKLGMTYGGIRDCGGNCEDLEDPKASYQALMGGGSSGFAAQLGGCRGTNGSFFSAGSSGCYWSSSPSGSSLAWGYVFYRDNGKLYRDDLHRGRGHSVRCLQGSN